MKKISVLLAAMLIICFATACCNLDSVKTSRDAARAKACAANMRVMHAAIDLHNLDHASDAIRTPDFSMFVEGGRLPKGGYIPSEMRFADESCQYTFTGDFYTDEDARISCTLHGTIEEIEAKYSK